MLLNIDIFFKIVYHKFRNLKKEAFMLKPFIVFGCFILGLLLIAVALFGMLGMWDSILFISLKPLQTSWEWPVGLIVAGLLVEFFGSIVMKTS